MKSRTHLILITLSIQLVTIWPILIEAHCPQGDQAKCYTVEEAEKLIKNECEESHQKLRKCNENLNECDRTEVDRQKCAGKVEELRKSNKQQKRIIKHLERKAVQAESSISPHRAGVFTCMGGAGASAARSQIHGDDAVRTAGYALGSCAAGYIFSWGLTKIFD